MFGSLFVIGIIVVPLCAKTLTRPRELQNTDQNDKCILKNKLWNMRLDIIDCTMFYWSYLSLFSQQCIFLNLRYLSLCLKQCILIKIICEFILANNAFPKTLFLTVCCWESNLCTEVLLHVAELQKGKHHDLFNTAIQSQHLWRL